MTRARRRRPVSPRRARHARADGAESLLLALAREVAARAHAGDRHGAIGVLVAAYAPDAPLTTALRKDWLRGRDDKTARLALAWAREQVRLALVEALQGADAARPDVGPDTLAWLCLAACEALAHEPPAAVADRVQALASFLEGK